MKKMKTEMKTYFLNSWIKKLCGYGLFLDLFQLFSIISDWKCYIKVPARVGTTKSNKHSFV